MSDFIKRFNSVFLPQYQKMEGRHWANGKMIGYSGAGVALALMLVIFQIKPTDFWLRSALAMSAVAVPIFVMISQICDQFEWALDGSEVDYGAYPVRLFAFGFIYALTPLILFFAIMFMIISFSGLTGAIFGGVSILCLIFGCSFGKIGSEKLFASKE